MQVLALGLSRSGTDSLRAALEELGLKTYHGFSTTDDGAGDAVIWCNLLRRKYKGEGGERERGDCLITKEEFDIVLGESEAVGFPSSLFILSSALPCQMQRYGNKTLILTFTR